MQPNPYDNPYAYPSLPIHLAPHPAQLPPGIAPRQPQQPSFVAPYPTPQPVYYTSDPAAYYQQGQASPHYFQQQPLHPYSHFYPPPAPQPPLPVQFSQQPSPALSDAEARFPTLSSAPAFVPQAPFRESSSDSAREASPFTPLQLADQAQYRYFPPPNTMADYSAHYSEAIRDLGSMKVDWLKATIKRINQSLALAMSVSGLKAVLHQRLRDQVGALYTQDKTRFMTAKRIIHEIALSPSLTSPYNAASYSYSGTMAGAAAAGWYSSPTSTYSAATNGYGASTSTAGYGARPATGHAAALPAPRFGGYNASIGASTSGAAGGASWQNQRIEEIPIKFRPSPFYRVEKSLSTVQNCIKAAQGDKKTVTVTFALTEGQRALLSKARESAANAQWQVRLYCTSDTNWNTSRPSSNQFPAPIEFPPTAEIKLNAVVLGANVKGIKKQPGTTPPVNLSGPVGKGPTVNLAGGGMNRVEVSYINTEKVYYLVAYLVEVTPIDKVVEKVKAGKTRAKEEVIKHIIDINSDEDIEATALGMSLRDPLSFVRIETPIRSVHCGHIACFDAMTWFEVNEQTPQWQCPICSKTLKVEDMIVDGYFQDILAVCSDNVDTVSVEPDGTWRSDDDKHGTAKPKNPANSALNSSRNTPLDGAVDKGKKRATPDDDDDDEGGAGGGGGGRSGAVLTLDSDDESEDMPLAKRPRLGGPASATPSVPNAASGVLDLTLSSDDENDDRGPVAPPSRPGGNASAAMARLDSGQDQKSAHEVQKDIDAMNKRMEQQYGAGWRERFQL
ncbi:hypothetical protein JCM11641_007574 [Rhodosporidiobolus odoratus]